MSKSFQICVLTSIIGLFFFPSLSCAEAASQGSSIGVINFQKNHVYFYTTVATFKSDDVIDIQYSNGSNSNSCCIHFVAGDFDEPALLDDPVADLIGDANIYRYEIKKSSIKINDVLFLGIALIHKPNVNINSVGEDIVWSENKSSSKASSCLSSEGMHFFRYINNNIVSHLYYSLGYDVRPTCDPKLFSSN